MVLQTKKESHLGFACLLSLLFALLFVRYAFNVDIPRIVLTSVVIVIAALGSRDEILSISFCCIPLHEAIDFYVALSACAVLLIFKNLPRMKVKASIIWGLLAVSWELVHLFWVDASFTSLIIAILPMAFLVMLLSFDMSEVDYPFIVRTLAVASAAFCMVILLNNVVQADFNFAKAVSTLRRLGMFAEDAVLTGGRINPNSLGIINVLAVTGLLQLRFVERQRVTDYMLCVVLLSFGVLTSSRTFLVCLLLMVILLILGQQGDTARKLRFVAILLAGILLAWLLLRWLFPSVLEYYIARFRVEDITTGRDSLMSRYHEFISGNFWVLAFGVGAADLSHKAVELYRIASDSPHNSIQEILVSWGIPGLLLIASLLFIMFLESKQYGKKKILLNFIPLIIILVKSMAGQLLTSGYSMLALAFAYLSLCQNFNPTDLSDQLEI